MKHLSTAHVIHAMSPDNLPALTVRSGETFTVETAKPGIPDEVFTRDYTTQPYPKRVLTITGPIFVEDAQPGDTLKVTVKDIQLDTAGKMWMGQWMGALMDEVDHCYMRKASVEDGVVRFSDALTFPVRPMIGTLGVAPAGESVDCVLPGDFGGNMDCLSIAPGSAVYLPVFVPGALLAAGDVHAAMGYGEVLGTGIEIGSTLTLQADVIKGGSFPHPVVETPDAVEVIASGTDFPLLCRQVTRSAVELICRQRGCGFDEAYAIAGQTADLRVLQIVNYSVSLSMSIPKQILA